MRPESRLAVLAHSASDQELRDVAVNLCAAAAILLVVGHHTVGKRIVDQAGAFFDLRSGLRWPKPTWAEPSPGC
jgi:hypothetical protein